jgi:hypothetical protein
MSIQRAKMFLVSSLSCHATTFGPARQSGKDYLPRSASEWNHRLDIFNLFPMTLVPAQVHDRDPNMDRFWQSLPSADASTHQKRESEVI